MVKDIELFYTPLQILNKITPLNAKLELSDFEYALICGLVKKVKPRKILELGVSTGATASILINCIDTLGMNKECHLFSVGKKVFLPDDSNNLTGFHIDEAKQFLERPVHHTLLLGDSVTELLNSIGDDIDLVLIKNGFSFPDVFIDFLSIFPFLKKNACVVLFGINPFLKENGEDNYAAKLLFDIIVADKIKPIDSKNSFDILNIGVLFLTDDSEKHISDCFSALLLKWQNIPNADILTKTKKFLSHFYNDDLMSLVNSAIEHNISRYNKHLTTQSHNKATRISISYKIGLAITLIPRKIYQILPRKKNKEITWQELRLKIKKQARKEAKKIHLSKNSFIFSTTGLKAKFYLPNYKNDLIQQSIIYYKTYFEYSNLQKITQEWCHGLISKRIKNSVVLDIGSNIGNHTLYFILECDAKIVHCFEPVKSTFEILKKNIIINEVEDRVCLHNLAVGKKLGTASVDHYEPDNIGGTSIKYEDNGSIKVISIDALKIAEEISLVKIDVEGFEKEVIAGMLQTIDLYHPFILIEIQKENFDEILNQLQLLGYSYVHLGNIDYLFFYTNSAVF